MQDDGKAGKAGSKGEEEEDEGKPVMHPAEPVPVRLDSESLDETASRGSQDSTEGKADPPKACLLPFPLQFQPHSQSLVFVAFTPAGLPLATQLGSCL